MKSLENTEILLKGTTDQAINRKERFLSNVIGPLMGANLPLIKNAVTPLAKSALTPLGK